jgi:hypothetical protein
MTVKFKIGFTIDGETLFGMIAKFLPVEDLQVEEVGPRVVPVATVATVATVARVARLVAPISPPRERRRGRVPMQLDQGANAIIIKALADGKPHSAGALKPLFRAAGYADSGVGSRLDKLKDAGVVHQPEFGLWQLTEAHLRKTA